MIYRRKRNLKPCNALSVGHYCALIYRPMPLPTADTSLNGPSTDRNSTATGPRIHGPSAALLRCCYGPVAALLRN